MLAGAAGIMAQLAMQQTMQEMDRRAMEEFGIPGLVLMENAGRCCVEEIIRHFGHLEGKRALILAEGEPMQPLTRSIERMGKLN